VGIYPTGYSILKGAILKGFWKGTFPKRRFSKASFYVGVLNRLDFPGHILPFTHIGGTASLIKGGPMFYRLGSVGMTHINSYQQWDFPQVGFQGSNGHHF